jgi:2-polyprenyl-3-methyl-5-hydroxy-6-metoxy-1,4-benzoquinol methylase
MNDVEKYYDLTAESTAKEWYPNDVLIPTQRDLMSLLPPEPSILDFGCGPGYESKRLHSLGAKVVGIDISGESIRIAKLNNPDCNFIRMDFLKVDRSIGPFNAVWASGSLIHVGPEQVPLALSTIADLLSERGILSAIIRDGNGKVVSYPVIDGIRLERTVFLYDQSKFLDYCRDVGLRYLRNGILDNGLTQNGWRCYFFEKI